MIFFNLSSLPGFLCLVTPRRRMLWVHGDRKMDFFFYDTESSCDFDGKTA